MRKLIITLAVAGLLVACTTADGSGESNADASLGTEPSALASGSAGAAASGPAGAASAACEEAFAPIADLEVESASDLGDLAEVEGTVESCESVADWTAGAEWALGIEVRAGTADLLLRIRCEDPSLSSAAICEELASS
jgi:hypothetical protein